MTQSHHSPLEVGNKGTSQSREITTSTSKQYHSRTPNIRSAKHQTNHNHNHNNHNNNNNNNNNNNKNETNNNMNKLTQIAQSYRDKLVAITNNMKTRTTTTTIEKE